MAAQAQSLKAKSVSTVASNADIWKVILASALGTMIEWYDFYIFGSLATVISTQFFPRKTQPRRCSPHWQPLVQALQLDPLAHWSLVGLAIWLGASMHFWSHC